MQLVISLQYQTCNMNLSKQTVTLKKGNSMAKDYTSTSFLIPCSAQQASIVQKAITFIVETSPDEGNALLAKSPDTLTVLEKLITRIVQTHPEVVDTQDSTFKDVPFPKVRLNLELDTEITEDGLVVCHEESIYMDAVIALTTAILSEFDLPGMVEISAAYCCDGEYGGVDAVVTAQGHNYLNRSRYFQTMQQAHLKEVKYALCSVMHYQNESRFAATYLLTCKATEDPYKVALTKLSSIHNAQPVNSDLFILSKDENTSIGLDKVTELTAFEYDGICKFLPSIDTLSPAVR